MLRIQGWASFASMSALVMLLSACGAPSSAGSMTPTPSTPNVTPPASPDASAPTTNTPSLNGTAWTLTSLNGSDVIEGTTITLSFRDGNQVGGNAGCNSYGGTFTAADDGTLAIQGIVSTQIACSTPEGVMQQEQRYLDVLQAITMYHLDNNQLRLETEDGRALVFTAGTK